MHVVAKLEGWYRSWEVLCVSFILPPLDSFFSPTPISCVISPMEGSCLLEASSSFSIYCVVASMVCCGLKLVFLFELLFLPSFSRLNLLPISCPFPSVLVLV